MTIPLTFGVWELVIRTRGKRYRYGNNPVRATELAREYGKAAVKLVDLYTDRGAAKSCAED